MEEVKNVREGLLKKHYHENCPGCKVDKAKELKTDVTLRNLFNIWMVVLCSSLPISSLFPYLYFMVRDFHIAEREEDISGYAGYVGSAFMLGRALTSILWGIVADRYGRKPIVLIGIVSVIIFNTLFGLSTSFWMAVIMRFLLGSLNGLLGPMKAYSAEIFREENQALGLSTFSAAWGIGLVIGPALGGYLAQPVEKYPHLFPKDSFWDKFPYFLPSLAISVFAFVALVASFWLPETLHNHPHSDESTDDTESLETGSNGIDNDKIIQKEDNLFLNWPLMSSIIVYCIISLHDIAYQEVFSLWAVSPRRLGGLNFTTDIVGDVLAVTGVGLIIFQLAIYPALEKAFGPIRFARITGGYKDECPTLTDIFVSLNILQGIQRRMSNIVFVSLDLWYITDVFQKWYIKVLIIPLLQSYPFIAMLSGVWLYVLINVASVLKNLLTVTIITGLFLLQNRAVDQYQRGAANGLSMTAMSVFKAIGPAAGGAILTWSQKRMHASFLPGTHMVFFLLNVVGGFGVLLMFTPFLKVKKKTPSEELR